MPVPLRVSLGRVRASAGLRREISERVADLEKFFPRIKACRVRVDMPHRHHSAGNRFHVRIELDVPGEDIVVTHEPTLVSTLKAVEADSLTKAAEADAVYRYLHVAVNRAFDAARRRLQTRARRLRPAEKSRPRRVPVASRRAGGRAKS